MNAREILEFLSVAERLKDVPRHCTTSKGRRESVAEHCWRSMLMAWLLREDFPGADMDKVMRMLLIHDLGEAFTGDIPVFLKTPADEEAEERALSAWVSAQPEPIGSEMAALYAEMNERSTPEAKIYKAIDGLEALIQHNESPLETWLENEYDLQKRYAWDRVEFSPELKALREEIYRDTLKKIEEEKR